MDNVGNCIDNHDIIIEELRNRGDIAIHDIMFAATIRVYIPTMQKVLNDVTNEIVFYFLNAQKTQPQ